MSEYRTLAERINRALAAIPGLRKQTATSPAPAPVAATRHKASKTRRIRRADQETQHMPAIQLSFLWYGNQAQNNQDQAG